MRLIPKLKLLLFFFLIVPVCSNIQAQYLFISPATVSVELSLTQSIIFKDIFNAQKETLSINKVKRIFYNNSRGEVSYSINENGFPVEHSILDSNNEGLIQEYSYNENGNITKYFFGGLQAGERIGMTYSFTYDSQNRMVKAVTSDAVMFSNAKVFIINYNDNAFPNVPTSITYYSGRNAVEPILFDAEITHDETGRITSVKNKEGKDAINIDYTSAGIDIDYLGDFVTAYKTADNRFTSIRDMFDETLYFYNNITGLTDSLELQKNDEFGSAKFILNYEYYN